MRRRLAYGVLALGVLAVHVPGAPAQTTSPPAPAPSTTASATSTPPAGATEPTATTRPVAAGDGGGGITAGGEGFPWIPVGIGILVAGLIGSRLRRASRR